jgi:DNA-binding NarL/FixJ family response regulator
MNSVISAPTFREDSGFGLHYSIKDPRVETESIRVVIADDQASTRRALRALLAFEPRIEIVGEAGDGKEAVRLIGELQPDLLLMDVHMPALDGLKATRAIKGTHPAVKIVVYTMFPGYQEEAYRAGADYFLIKGSPGATPAQIILSFFPLKKNTQTDGAVKT